MWVTGRQFQFATAAERMCECGSSVVDSGTRSLEISIISPRLVWEVNGSLLNIKIPGISRTDAHLMIVSQKMT
jgi:hypothetical protein